SPAGSAIRPAQRHRRPRRGFGVGVAGRGKDLRPGYRCPTDQRSVEQRPLPRRYRRGRAHAPQRRGHEARRRVVDANAWDAKNRAGMNSVGGTQLGSTYARVARLPLAIERCELLPLVRDTSSGFTKVSIVVRLGGGGHEGEGEDITWD